MISYAPKWVHIAPHHLLTSAVFEDDSLDVNAISGKYRHFPFRCRAMQRILCDSLQNFGNNTLYMQNIRTKPLALTNNQLSQ